MAELPAPTHEPDAVRRAVEAVLARPEFTREEPGLWQRFTDSVRQVVLEVLETVFGSARAPEVGTVVLVAALVVALGLGLWFARGVRRSGRPPEPEPVVERRRTAAEWLGDAARAERGGRWRDALRYRYRALLAELDRRGTVEDAQGRTSGEHLADVRVRVPEAAAEFEQVTRRFEAAWYGRADVDEASVAAFAGVAAAVVRAVGPGDGPGVGPGVGGER